MKNPIDFPDLFNRVSGNKEFAHRMLTTFFDSYEERYTILMDNFSNQRYDELADSVHQLKGILGNLAIPQGFDLLKIIHEQARLKNHDKLEKLLEKLKKSIEKAKEYFDQNQEQFN